MRLRFITLLGVFIVFTSSCGAGDATSGGSAGAGARTGTSGSRADEGGSHPSAGAPGDDPPANGGSRAGSGGDDHSGAAGREGTCAGTGGAESCDVVGGAAGTDAGPAGGGSANAAGSNAGGSGPILSDSCLKCIQVSGGSIVNACTTEMQCADCLRGIDCTNASADVKARWGEACAAMRSSCSAQCLLDAPKPVCPTLDMQ